MAASSFCAPVSRSAANGLARRLRNRLSPSTSEIASRPENITGGKINIQMRLFFNSLVGGFFARPGEKTTHKKDNVPCCRRRNPLSAKRVVHYHIIQPRSQWRNYDIRSLPADLPESCIPAILG